MTAVTDLGALGVVIVPMPIRFSLKSLFALVFVAGVCAAVYARYVPRPLPVTKMSCTQPWSEVTKHRVVVAFVDCDVNGWTHYNRDLYESFCRWFRRTYGQNVILIDTGPGRSGETWNVLQRTWRERNVHTGAYKTWGGAGQVLWIRNGVVTDTAFYPHFKDLDSMKDRTSMNFR